MSYYIPDDDEDIVATKYNVGDSDIRFPNIKEYTLLFAFDYLSLNATKLCFNNPNISKEDFVKIYEFKQQVSTIKIGEFIDNTKIKQRYHFHDIQVYQKTELKTLFERLLGKGKTFRIDQLPTLYQFAIFTDNKTNKAPRIVGFFGKMGVFHALWLDYEHSIFPKK
ncbi:hypothetical protein VB796_10200 [Arcicella sp. LKC2W]|uniref:hypothetical protein n=1 Tax=Arcicella sp. LKC2W TaxID=2984198 RepID=UPI002B1FD8D8|nr:hypothetical protein [Arcicella sp. LKC2W]MEA5459412.1 hypothetical protein [Arcicella sp. LKC2W]